MNDGPESTRISLRLADGRYFPIFRHGDPDTRNLSLVPASENQNEADIQFYYHSKDGSEPVSLGTVKFPDLPSGTEETELHLDAVIGPAGLLSVAVRHRESGRLERLEMDIPNETGNGTPLRRRGEASRRSRVLLGLLFVVAGAAAIIALALAVTDWGKQDVPPPPLSALTTETPAV
jgi:hypothetical protein